MALSVPLHDIIAYRKVSRSFFSLLDALCHNHAPALAARDGPALRSLLVQHLDNKRDAVLELMRAGTLHGAACA